MEYFIADLHIGDKGILQYEHRPFNNVKEMEDTIVSRWNNKVNDDDTIYLLGDIGELGVLKKLKGNIVIVVGNHDDYEEVMLASKKNPNIKYVSKYPMMVGPLWLSHEPIGYMPPEIPYLNVHGHLHRFNYGLLDRTWDCGNRYFCVSVEQIDYAPISKEEIAKKLEYHGAK